MNAKGGVYLLTLPLFVMWLAGCQSGNAERGFRLFHQRGCSYCHTIGAAKSKQGPDLARVGKRFSRGELRAWLSDPELVYKDVGKRPINKGFSPMPRITLTPDEIKDLVAYLMTLKAHASSKAD